MSELRRCRAIKAGGARCSAGAQKGSDWCWNHDPSRAAERRTNASAGGRARSRRPPDELDKLKNEVRAVTVGVLNGRVDRGTGAVVLQGFNTLLRSIEVQRKLDAQNELEERVAELRVRLNELRRKRSAG